MADKDRMVRINISQLCLDEFQIMSIRTKKTQHDLMREVLENFIDKRKDKQSE